MDRWAMADAQYMTACMFLFLSYGASERCWMKCVLYGVSYAKHEHGHGCVPKCVHAHMLR